MRGIPRAVRPRKIRDPRHLVFRRSGSARRWRQGLFRFGRGSSSTFLASGIVEIVRGLMNNARAWGDPAID